MNSKRAWIAGIVAGLALFVAGATNATSVSATGTVHSTWTTDGIKYVKIVRPDGSTLAADCGSDNSPISSNECSIANVGETSWGRASCSGGYCSWSCLEVVDSCTGSFQVIALNGTVVGKDTCAGVLYLTLLVSGSEIRARCEGDLYDDCNSLTFNSSVAAGINLHCADAQWEYVIP